MGLTEWGIRVDSRVVESLKGLQPKEATQVAVKMLEISRNPCPPDSRSLRGVEGGRRVDVGGFRLLYHVDHGARRVVFFVGGRRNDDEVYRELESLRRRIRDHAGQTTATQYP